MSQTVQLTSPPLMEIPADSMAPVLPKELMAAASHPHSIICSKLQHMQTEWPDSSCMDKAAHAWINCLLPGPEHRQPAGASYS